MSMLLIPQEHEVDVSWWLARHGFAEHDLEKTVANQTTALMLAARYGAIEVARELLHRGAPRDARNADGNNALWFACFARHLALIDLLCSAGIDIDNQNDNGATCLMYAASAGIAPVVARLLEHGADPTLRSLDDFDALDMASSAECFGLLRNRRGRYARVGARARASDVDTRRAAIKSDDAPEERAAR